MVERGYWEEKNVEEGPLVPENWIDSPVRVLVYQPGPSGGPNMQGGLPVHCNWADTILTEVSAYGIQISTGGVDTFLPWSSVLRMEKAA